MGLGKNHNITTIGGSNYIREIRNITTLTTPTLNYNVFQLFGAIRIHDIWGHILTQLDNVAARMNLELFSANGSLDITNAPPGANIQNLVAGAIMVRNANSSVEISVANPDTTPALTENTVFNRQSVDLDVVADNSADTFIRMVLDTAMSSGEIEWHILWHPLVENSYLLKV